MMPIGSRFRGRSALRLDLMSFDFGGPAAKATMSGIDGHLRGDIGVAWSVPLGRSWLHAAVLLDAVIASRRIMKIAAGTLDPVHTWADPTIRAAPGVAVAVGFGWWSATAFGRYVGPRNDVDPLIGTTFGRRGLEAGVSIDTGTAALGVPLGVMLEASTWGEGQDNRVNDAALTLYYHHNTLRVGLSGRVVFGDGPLTLEWPATVLNLRVDWMPAAR